MFYRFYSKSLFCISLSCLTLLVFAQDSKKWTVASFGLNMTTHDVPVRYSLEEIFGMTKDPTQIEQYAQNKTFNYAQHQNFPFNFYLRLRNPKFVFGRYSQEISLGLTIDMARELIIANLPIVNTRPFYTKGYMAYCLMMDGYLANAAYGLTNNLGTKWLTWRMGIGASMGLTSSNRIILFSDDQSIHESNYPAKKTYYSRAYIYIGLDIQIWRGLQITLHYQNTKDFELNHYQNSYKTETIHVGFAYSLSQKKKKQTN